MIPRRTIGLALVGLVLILAQPPRASAVSGPSLTLFPWGGYANFAKNVNLKDTPVYGGTIGLSPYRYVSIEGHFGRGSTHTVFGYTPYALTPPPAPIEREVEMLHYGGDL